MPPLNKFNLKKPARFLVCIIGGYFCAVFVLGIVYSVVTPPSTLMIASWLSGEKLSYKNVPLKKVNRNLINAVLSAEDDRFCEHLGIDFYNMERAIDKADSGRKIFGTSTLSQQVAKNLFLWPQRSYLRKALELPITAYLELIWSKRRILEVYLSIAEWGDGIFGAEAASRKYFHKPAANLSPWESAQLAAALPNPHERRPDRPSEFQNNYAELILKRMNNGVNTSCLKR